jgi:hypothetical protein
MTNQGFIFQEGKQNPILKLYQSPSGIIKLEQNVFLLLRKSKILEVLCQEPGAKTKDLSCYTPVV